MDLRIPHFWTSTINNWKHLLQEDSHKDIINQSLQWLVNNKMIAVYGFTIMPNHVHLIWEQLQMNGKEYPKSSFQKFTAHKFQKSLRSGNPGLIELFKHQIIDINFLFWQRDPLAIKIIGRDMAIQKLEYIHHNPLQIHWNLITDPVKYKYSSANYYETGIDEFNILTHYMDRF